MISGSKQDLATHYTRPFQVHLWDKVKSSYFNENDDLCIGEKKRHDYNLGIVNQFFKVYQNNTPTFAVSHYNEYSHDGNSRLSLADEELYRFLKDNYETGIFDNTVIFMFSDHGSRFGDDRKGTQGYLEERLPFFAVYLPEDYKNNNPSKFLNLKKNRNRLLTPFDVHETIRELTCLDSKESIRSISLLNIIPSNRTCESIGISQHFCSCIDWYKLDIKSDLAQDAAKFTVNFMNDLIKLENSCKTLYLENILSSKSYILNDIIYIFLKIETSPNFGIYELQVEYSNKKFSIRASNDISRINSYESQSFCHYKLKGFVDLRKFCDCK